MGENPKHIALYRERQEQLWSEAESQVRQEYDAYSASNGAVLAQLAAAFLGNEGPLEPDQPAVQYSPEPKINRK